MAPLVLLLALSFSGVCCRPKESTHDLLSRLGFDPVHKTGVNYHTKRVAEESNKPRFGGTYNSDTDSHMFVVRLPPHHPYYSDLHPEKLENEVTAKRPLSIPVNGKPAQVYHWNIPLIKKLAKQKKTHKHDSKIVRLKISPNDEEYQYYKKLKKDGKPSVYKLKKEHVMSIKELAEHQNDRPIPDHKLKTEHLQNDVFKDSKLTHILTHPTHPKHSHNSRKTSEKSDSNLKVVKYTGYHQNKLNKYDEEKKTIDKTPYVYSPALPKNNSFYKYFPGNGKPKSFYVIEKNQNPSRFHRLL